MNKLTVLLTAVIATPTVWGTSLHQYLDQVKNQNNAYEASEIRYKGAELQKREAGLFFTPQFFFNAQKGHDSKLLNPPFLVFDQVRTERYSAGISQEFSLGVETKLQFDLQKNEYRGVSFNSAPNPYWDAIPALEVNIPLWANFGAKASKAKKELALQQRTYEQQTANNDARQALVEAEVAYWRLSAAQESVAIQKKALDAATNIYNYVEGKRKKNLGEEADVLQARALSESYQLQLAQAEIEERAAKRSYNFYLNQEADVPTPTLSGLDYDSLKGYAVPSTRPGDRPDVMASRAQVALAKANSQVSEEQNKPTFNLYGGYALFGRGTQSEAFKKAGYPDRDTMYVGIKYNMPLNFSAQKDAREGARQNQRAAELNHHYLNYAQEQNWIDLTQKLKDAQLSLKLATSMEKAQRSKLDNERTRLRQGRTTTYQVLLFEQDYLSAEVQRIRAASQIINYKSQIQLYSSTK